jgi:hypothetical protein
VRWKWTGTAEREMRKTFGYEGTDTLKELREMWVIDRNLFVNILSASTGISGK